ncbi:peptide ABC transporter permease [Rhodovulum sulfidophilum]|uniref:ABC transporter permease n=1 Tax=Rhodovulum visakhapatnamense TaxID=364297 RepID=UPI0009510104|nr:ABC transporter permease [Rhodovulum visakhapatnamense]MBL3568739.1 ABC transporter permease [Rhodovulum visakhapatnamense]OLS44936.1 peptide ABC transporter permease [Rhodovulum sulfidophilum]
MERLSWTGALGPWLVPALEAALIALALAALAHPLALLAGYRLGPGPEAARSGPGRAARLTGGLLRLSLWALAAVLAAFLIGGLLVPPEAKGILGRIATRLWPVWLSLGASFALVALFRRRLGLLGHLLGNPAGAVGLALVMFWVFAALFADQIAPFDPVTDVIAGMKNKPPGTPLPAQGDAAYGYYLLGGDALARDVFSRAVAGARVVLAIAPAATLFAFMVGITLGLPAGYLGGRLDLLLSFLANLVLAFPVILLFFLLVTPEIVAMGVPTYMAGALFLFPLIFLTILWNSRFRTRPPLRAALIGATLVLGGWLYAGLAWNADPFGVVAMPAGVLIVFVSVVFVNAPSVFRIVRGLTLDIRTRDYVAAAQTRGEGPWYIMLWEILPNARGPLLVDFCLRIGYTTILLGTLGFFGLGLAPESPDWGTSINAGRGLLQFVPFPPLVPAIAIMSLVLGMNLLADGLREESLRE